MDEQTQTEKYDFAMRYFFESMFEELQGLSVENTAMREVITTEPNRNHLEQRSESILRKHRGLHEIPRYIDLRNQAIEAVLLRDSSAITALVPQVRERISVWGGIQEQS